VSADRTFSFGALDAGLFGLARLGAGSGLGLLFAGDAVAAARAEGSGDAGVSVTELEPERRWRVAFADAFALEFTAVAPAVELRAGGAESHEQLCRVRGEAAGRRVDGLGQRGAAVAHPDWGRTAVARTVTAWLGEDRALALAAVRGRRARDHGGEAVAAGYVLGGTPVRVDEARLSTTYDAEGRQRHAGVELLLGGDEDLFPHRLAGAAVCGTTLELGRLRLDTAFFRWHSEGRVGTGRFDVVRPADAR
jgi:hypothetical protein